MVMILLTGMVYASAFDVFIKPDVVSRKVAVKPAQTISLPKGEMTRFLETLKQPASTRNTNTGLESAKTLNTDTTTNLSDPSVTTTKAKTTDIAKTTTTVKITMTTAAAKTTTAKTTTAKTTSVTTTTAKTTTTTTPKSSTSSTTTSGSKLTPPSGVTMTANEKLIFDLVNQARVADGAKSLQHDGDLTWLARLKSQDIVDNNYFDHYSPTYGSVSDMLKAAGISYRCWGENIARTYSAEKAFTNWMNSSGHRANILNPKFTHIGIGIAKYSSSSNIYTQIFIGR